MTNEITLEEAIREADRLRELLRLLYQRSKSVEHKHCHRDNHTPLYGLELHIEDAIAEVARMKEQGR